jgi:hypothetical protein
VPAAEHTPTSCRQDSKTTTRESKLWACGSGKIGTSQCVGLCELLGAFFKPIWRSITGGGWIGLVYAGAQENLLEA